MLAKLNAAVIRTTAALAIAALGATALSACQQIPTDTPAAPSEILTMSLPADVSAKGVLLAAVLLSTADIEAALSEGLVTPAEIDLAQTAIDDGLIDQWRQRAEQDLTRE